MVQDLASLIPALQAAKKSLQAVEPLTRAQRLEGLARLADVWGGDVAAAELAALAAESGLSEALVRDWDFAGAAAYLRAFVAGAGAGAAADPGVTYAPRGVISLLQPRFHGPRLFVERFAPAYLAGDPVLVKMSSKTPTAGALAERWLRAAGIAEEHAVVVAGASAGYAGLLVQHPAVSAVSAVGRRETLLRLYRECAELGRAFQGFAGGRATMFVMELQDADGWEKLLGRALRDGGGQRPYDNLRVFVLEKDEKAQLASLEAALPRFEGTGARISGHLTQCSEDHQAEALGPVILFSSIKYPFDLAKWVNNAATGFAVQLFGPVERLEKIAPKLEAGAILANADFDPAGPLLFGVKESVLGDTRLEATGGFFAQRTWRSGFGAPAGRDGF